MRRLVVIGGLVPAVALGLVLVGGVVLRPDPPAPAAGAGPGSAVATSTVDGTARSIAAARERLARLPGDWTAWAGLGLAYVQQARITGDPANYARAEEALNRSLSERPDGNAPALAGLGALAAARHDFGVALDWGNRAVAADPYRAGSYGVVADALTELGRYDEAFAAVQQMVDLRPDTASYARASYTFELRGDPATARSVMDRALTAAAGPADAAFALEHLAGIAFDTGDLAAASSYVDDGLRRFRDHPPLLAMRGRIAAARGDTASAVAAYSAALARLPQPAPAAELGDLLAATGDPAGAERQYTLVRASSALLREQGVDVDTELAVFAADHGDPAGALTAARAAYAKRPSIWAADALGWALHASGRPAEALTHADAALRLGTRSPVLLFHRGAIHAALGDAAAARADLSAALALNPAFSPRHAPEANRLLAGL